VLKLDRAATIDAQEDSMPGAEDRQTPRLKGQTSRRRGHV
jgi:hypothetical protein